MTDKWPRDDLGRFARSLQDPEEVQRIIDEYFESRWAERKLSQWKDGEKIEITEPYMRPPTMAGIALALGCSRMTLWRYMRKGEEDPCYPVLARALSRVAEFAEEALYTREAATGARFALEVNHGYGREEGAAGGGGFVQNIIPPSSTDQPTAIPKWGDPDED